MEYLSSYQKINNNQNNFFVVFETKPGFFVEMDLETYFIDGSGNVVSRDATGVVSVSA